MTATAAQVLSEPIKTRKTNTQSQLLKVCGRMATSNANWTELETVCGEVAIGVAVVFADAVLAGSRCGVCGDVVVVPPVGGWCRGRCV